MSALKTTLRFSAQKSRLPATKLTRTPVTSPPCKVLETPGVKRVKDLLGRMTLEEQAAQMMCVWQEKGQKFL